MIQLGFLDTMTCPGCPIPSNCRDWAQRSQTWFHKPNDESVGTSRLLSSEAGWPYQLQTQENRRSWFCVRRLRWTLGHTIRTRCTKLDDCCQAGFSDCDIWFDWVNMCAKNFWALVISFKIEALELRELSSDTTVVSLMNGTHA